MRPPRTWLYVPGDRPDRFDKAVRGGADVVVLDLEDAVAPERRAQARSDIAAWLAGVDPGQVEVRVNPVGSEWFAEDLRWLEDLPPIRAVRVPKVEIAASLPDLGRPLVPIVESALGVENAFVIASAPGVLGLALGEADLRSDLGIGDEAGLAWARSRIVNAARAAGRPAPAMSVFPDIADLDGLAASCRTGRTLGFHGRAAVHPSQVPVIDAAFQPDADQVATARETLAASERGPGVTTTGTGRMVDPAMLRQAREVLLRAGESP